MKSSIASVLATLFVAQAAFAQAPEPAPNPVEEQEVDASQEVQPAEGTGLRIDAAPATTSAAAANEEEAWDVSNPRGFTIRQVPIRTDEGTWIDVDVSPDGRTLAFALLGDIYTMPIAGGTPRRIAEGLAWEVQPRFSPDGRRIAFTSDRGGGDNIWVMDADGSNKSQVTKEDFRLLNQPDWSPDGKYIVAKKHFTTQRSLGTGEIWLYHPSGGGGVKLVARASEALQKELGEPIYAPSGDAVYYTRNVTGGPIFEYAQDSTQGTFAIERYDLTTTEVTTAASGYGGAVRPTPSPDGRSLAFIRRDKDQTELWVKNLATGVERMVYGDLDFDMQETWAVYGFYPRMDWTPDGSAIVAWAGGKIRRIAADGSGSSVIPFAIDDTRGVADAPHPAIPVGQDSFTARIPRFASVSPDGRTVIFESLGKLYAKPLGGGEPRRWSSGEAEALELWPSWSRDGRRVTFVRWTDDGLSQVMVADANGRGARAVTSMPGHYAKPQFSPDGRTIVFEKREGGYLTSPEYSENPGIYAVAAAGGDARLVARGMTEPQFGATSERMFMLGQSEGKLQLISADLEGDKRQVHAEGELVSGYSVSPRGDLLAFRENYEVFVTPLMPGGQAVTLGEKSSSLPVTRASKGGADYIGWTDGGSTLTWSMGPTLYRAMASDMIATAPQGEDAPTFAPPETGISLARTIAADKAQGVVALTGARILTMAGDGAGIVENGTIVIRGDRIEAVGSAAEVAVPGNATVIDAAGKTIMPGLVDAHAHGAQGVGDLIPQQNWSLVQNLALGTTTLHDPSSQASMIFAAAERQRAGSLLAPRIFSTGEIIYGAKAPSVFARIDGYEDALAHVRRIKAQGGVSVKNYNQPRREQRQQVVAAAKAENMLVVAEGGSLFGMDMNLIADGNSTVEHNVPVEYFYEDVLQFWGGSQTNNTPTLVVTYGGLAGDPYWRQATDVFDNPLLVHTPPRQLIADTARRVTAPDWAFVDDDAARETKKLAERGVKIAIGAHGQQAGIAAHWELWSFVRGGMTPVEALRAGTIWAAQSLGMDRDVGSLEVGKLADLLILSADPSDDIQNSDDIERVMLGGRLYDARTMNEVVTGSDNRLPYWWE